MTTQKRIVYITPPRISPLHIKEKISCIRSHRERIFQVATTVYRNKLICHNYGHGGAGWTFLFGAVHESIRQFHKACESATKYRKQAIAVIGAGCHGLLTAVLLARQGYQVRIIADQLDTLTSYKAAGFFFPKARTCSNDYERSLFKAFGFESYAFYQQVAAGQHPFLQAGAQFLPVYYGHDLDPGFTDYIQQKLMQPAKPVTVDFGNRKTYDLWEYIAPFIDTNSMMQELHRNRCELGIRITHMHLASFDDVPETILFNCAGYGAKLLAADHHVIPVLGHLISLTNQPDPLSMKYMLNVKVTMSLESGRLRDELIYFVPKEEGLVGITFKRGQDSLTADEYEFDRIITRCMDYFGSY